MSHGVSGIDLRKVLTDGLGDKNDFYNTPYEGARLLFFFQAEDGIRDGHVTGVQTCALPISGAGAGNGDGAAGGANALASGGGRAGRGGRGAAGAGAGGGRGGSAYLTPVLDRNQIGRASCRERGVNWEEAGRE